MEHWSKYLFIFLIITLIGYGYDQYKAKYSISDEERHIQLVKKYLLSGENYEEHRPILWIHVQGEKNARNWLNFGSRTSTQMNQPYLLGTLQTIIHQATGDFNVCLIDDESFARLIPNWSVDLSKIPDPMKTHMRSLSLLKILYYYGGFLVPSSYLALEPMRDLYDLGMKNKSCFSVEQTNHNVTSNSVEQFPNHRFIGTTRLNPIIKRMMNEIEILNSMDYTSEQDFLGNADRICLAQIMRNNMSLVGGKLIGIKDKSNQVVQLDDLLNDSYFPFSPHLLGILIPSEEILRRNKYQWFARLSIQQVYESNTVIGKYMLIAAGKMASGDK